MSWRSFVAIVTATFLLAAPAHAQTSTGLLFASGGPTAGSAAAATDIPTSTTGELVVSFHGDTAAGCATEGLCGYSGTVIARLGSGNLLIEGLRHARDVGPGGFLSLGLGADQGVTFARVDRVNAGGVCADEQQFNTSYPLTVRRGSATVSLSSFGDAPLVTRCAGPVEADLAATLPHVTAPASLLVRGRTQLALSTNRPFIGRGFAGTVTSTVIVHLGRPQRQNASSSSHFPAGIKTEQIRTVSEVLTGIRGAGSVTSLVNGSGDTTECELLDSCGLTGALTLSPNWSRLGGSLYAMGPATRSYRDFLAALGLARGNPRGIQVFGNLGWSRDGTLTADLLQSGTCTDSAALAPGQITLEPQGHSISASYIPGTPSRTRCPGPVIPQGQALASGKLSLSELRHRTFTLSLSGGQPFQDDGYTAATRGRLTLTVRRGRISQRVTTQPAGA